MARFREGSLRASRVRGRLAGRLALPVSSKPTKPLVPHESRPDLAIAMPPMSGNPGGRGRLADEPGLPVVRRVVSDRRRRAAAGGRVVRRELRPAVEPIRRGAARGGRGDVPGEDRGRSARPGRPPGARRRLRRRPVCPAAGRSRGPGRRRGSERRRREGRRVVRRAARRRDRPGRPARPAGRRGGLRPGVFHRGPAPYPRPCAGRSRRSPAASSPADAWRSGCTAATRRPRSGSTPGLRAVSTRLPAPVLEPLCAGLGALGEHPGGQPHPQQAGQLLEPSRLDPPRLRQLRLVRPALPVAPYPRRAAAMVRRGRASPTSPSCPPPGPAGSTTGPTATTSSSAAGSISSATWISGQWSVVSE